MKRKKIKPKLKPLTYWATLSLLLFGLLVMSGPSLVFAQAAPVIDPVDDINVAAGGTAAVTITVTDDGVPYTGSLELYDKREPVGSLNNPTITPIIVISASDYTFTDNLDDSFTFSWDTTGFDGGSYLARFTADDGINPAVDELFSINVAQVIPATILARTFSDPLPWYGGNPVAPFTVAIETSPAKNLGWITAGEYVEYVIDVPAAGEYNFEFFAGKGNGGTLTTTLSEEDGLGGFSSIGSFGATDTGWQNYASYTFSAIFANAGVQTLRLDFSGGGGINIRDFIISPPGDNVPPVITLNGVDPVVLNVGDPFNDPEATVVDDVDGTITTSLAGDVSGLDTNTVGSYEIPYNATDAAGNAAAEVLRTVHVFPTTAGTPLYRVNAGGPLVAAIDGSGVDWEQDQGAFGDANNSTYLLDLPTGTTIFTASSGSAHPGAVDTSDASIPATTPATIFDTERYDNNGGTPDMVWQFPVTPGTDYEVRFYFAELFSGVDEVGQRVASINIEGNVPAILTDIDQIAIAGPKGGFMRSTIINAGDSLLDIETVRVVQNPAFKAIEIIDLSPPPNQPPVITAILPQTVNEDGNLSVPLTISDAEGDDLTVSITTASDEPLLLQTVNGGSNNVQADPYPFTADGFFSESSINDTSGSYTSSLDFTPTFGDGGGADGDGDGKYTITIEVDDGNGNVETNTFELTVNDVAQSIAGTGTTKIEAESFDNQGPANPNPNGSGNSNGIGVEVNGSGVTNIGYSHNGDFVEYEIDVAQAGTYDIEFQIGKSNGADGTLNIVDPVTSNVLGSIAVNDATGGWQVYQPFSTQIALPSGPQTLRFEWVSATTNFLFNVDFFELTYVPPPNSDPDAVDDSVTTDEDTAVTIDVLDNDTDADAGDVLSVTGDSGASNGTTLINPDNTITYTPDTNFNGSDSFTYDISDGNSGTDTATVNITVNPINDAPVNTVPGPQSVDEDVPLAVTGISAADVDGNLASTELSVSNGTLAVTLSGSATINAGANGSSALTISGSEADINGTLASLTYQGDLNFNGGDVLTVVSTDSAGVPLSDTDTVAITVNPVNNPPVNTVPGAQLIDEDEPLSISGISVTDVDGNLASAEISVDNGTLTVILGNATLSAGANGSSSLTLTGAEADINSALGSLSYQGSLNFNGGDTLTIVSTDGAGNPLSDTDTVSITVDPVNDPPVAVNDGETTSEETPITIDVLTNDSDVDTGDVITLDSASSPTSEGGTAIINAGQIDYTPALNFNGTDTFTYQISDIDGETASATVTVVVGAANDVPVANDDTASVDEDMTVVIDVLDNDTDADVGDTLVVDSIFSDPASGTAIINLNGDIEYTPSANFNGSDSLEYLLSDENGGFDTALVTITVNPINDDPLAEDDVTSTAEDTAVVINVLVNDSDIEGDDLEISSAGPASNGIVAISNDLLSVTYTPALNFNGSDSFDYTISDGNGGTATASVTVNVGSANDNPTAVDDTVTTDEDSPITIAVLDNDTDPDIGTSLSVASTSLANSGTVDINPDNTVTYTPDPNFFGSDSFVYSIIDGSGGSDTGTVNVTVTPINDLPIAVNDSASSNGGPVTIDVLDNDSDDDNDPLSVTTLIDPADGTVVKNPDDTVTYTPDPGFSGTDTFGYTLSDGNNGTAIGFVTVSVSQPQAFIEINPGGNLGASTYGGSSAFQITNQSQGGIQIAQISIDLSTSVLPDLVFDPIGAGGDALSQCFNADPTAATAVGLTTPSGGTPTDNTNPACVDPFSVARQGGFDVITLDFTDFDPGELFSFSTDIDPNSIQGVAGAGNAGAVSGFELSGATVTITFSDGSVVLSSLYEDGSLGGGQAVVAPTAPSAPVISVDGIGSGPATVNDINQTIVVTGTPGDYVSLLQVDSRLFIASGDPPFNVADPTYYANQALAKALYTAEIGPGGTVNIPLTLLATPGANGSPDGGLNQFIAVTSETPYAVDQQVSQTSNLVTLLYEPPSSSLTGSLTLQGRSNHATDIVVELYAVGTNSNPLYSINATSDASGDFTISNIDPGTYQVAVKANLYLQTVETMTLVNGSNSASFGQQKAGDANNDNFVTGLDFSTLATAYNTAAGDPDYNPAADFNGDGFVTGLDFSVLAVNFNTGGEVPTLAP